MPLKALLDDREVVSIFLSDAEWVGLRDVQQSQRTRFRMADGARAIAKVSSRGLRFFAHAPGEGHGVTAPESPQHLALKAAIARTCKLAGWSVDVEAPGDGWIADVLATRGETRIAFEVQWSHQSEIDYAYRTTRYRAAGVESVWLRRVTPGRYAGRAGPNVFNMPIRASDPAELAVVEAPHVDAAAREVDVDEFTRAVLHRRVSPVGPHVSAWNETCWRSTCGRKSRVWVVDGEQPWPEQRSLARQARRYIPTKGAPLATIAPRTTKGSGRTYDALCCPHCGAVFGDNFVFDHLRRYQWIDTIRLPGNPDDPWMATTLLVPAVRKAPVRPVGAEVPATRRKNPPEKPDLEGDTSRTTRVAVEGSPTRVWVEKCYREACGKPMTAWAVKGEATYPKTRTLARNARDSVEPIDGHPLMLIDVRRVPGFGMVYDVPCCPHCNEPQRDFF